MTDLLLIPDIPTVDVVPAQQLRLVTVEIPPTAEVPVRAAKEHPPCHAPCPTCGALVLTGETTTGLLVVGEPNVKSYVPTWLPDTPRPVLHESRGYPVHRCGGR
jgi:hypothetical protein